MRTQLRRQAAAHTDHVRDVIKVQEQELRAEAEQVFTSVTSEMVDELMILSSKLLQTTLEVDRRYCFIFLIYYCCHQIMNFLFEAVNSDRIFSCKHSFNVPLWLVLRS